MAGWYCTRKAAARGPREGRRQRDDALRYYMWPLASYARGAAESSPGTASTVHRQPKLAVKHKDKSSGSHAQSSRLLQHHKGGNRTERSFCWTMHEGTNLDLHDSSPTFQQRCNERFDSLVAAQRACEAARSWCGGITRDSGMRCGASGLLEYELRVAERVAAPSASITSWLMSRSPGKNSTRTCESGAVVGRRAIVGGGRRHSFGGGGGDGGGGGGWARPPPPSEDDLLGSMLAEKLRVADERMQRGPPAFERFPEQAFRYRDWGAQTRHGRGDMYPLYTLDTLRNLADHLFDSSTGYQTGPERASRIAPCSLLYSTLRPTSAFLQKVHAHIRVPYLLMTDTADDSITHYPGVNHLLSSAQLFHWWAVDNEILDAPKLEGLPLGVMDALELGIKRSAPSVTFHANVSDYLATLIAAQQQPKSEWLMMQMTETHPERRRVRATFSPQWGAPGDIRLTQEHSGTLRLRLVRPRPSPLSLPLFTPRGAASDRHNS